MFIQAGHVSGDGIFDVGDGFVPRLPLRNAPRKRGTLGDKTPVFILLDDDSVKHAKIFASMVGSVNVVWRRFGGK